MKYDLKEVLKDRSKVSLEWHGKNTLVQFERNAKKEEVKTGDVVKVSHEVAHRLLSYSDLWTLEGDKPVVHGWRQVVPAEAVIEADDVLSEDFTQEEVSKMRKPELLERLADLEIELTGDEKVPELKEILLSILAEDEEIVEDVDEDDEEVEAEE